ncbi:unnamed protein product [Zymoseptoria tritici ST99CH_1A5]|uniref:Uncharacterized protein n=3 Tax=Zymoseptoria tritici TaxID=1047171 RepID=A0A1X7RUP4_ZYMT9|nr:unnamed protein product [Zymoseptoria tritici ST99CH_3D7]SMR53058.1 unnamed protein product [Zymoseptoria tritici ST99CH_1E4]SMR54627.1 unnamed protein product [Zymoseptoria tritici ST99CH_3D1]SMY24799.1 unnamed protein product [Zymoseptoria tritici ST99CH_1A5]
MRLSTTLASIVAALAYANAMAVSPPAEELAVAHEKRDAEPRPQVGMEARSIFARDNGCRGCYCGDKGCDDDCCEDWD